jgi:hypothetical protein
MPVCRATLLAFIVTAAVAAPPLAAQAAEGPPKLEDLTVLPVAAGINSFPGLPPRGEEVILVKAWRDNGNAHGFSVTTAMVRESGRSAAAGGWDFVSYFDGDKEILAATDNPHTGDDAVRSLLYATAILDGQRQTLAVVAQRQTDKTDSPADPAPVSFKLYQLTARPDDDPLGRPARFFQRVAEWRPVRPYCSADAALAAELRLPPPAGLTADGCGAGGR